jgi:hypothetical protein
MKPSLKRLSLLLALLILSQVNVKPAVPTWDKWQYLIGEWEAAGRGSPGEGAGRFSFAFDLRNKVVVRKSHTDYPAAAGRPAFAHDDLMVIYYDEPAQKFRADYFDSEGHVIRYTAEFSPDDQTLTFVSEPAPAQPRFRLTYLRPKNNSPLGIKFEIAPPGEPENFKVYVEGTAHKKGH